ncbi:hypothetical protein ACHAPQ_004065 [Fusarium lateritium]
MMDWNIEDLEDLHLRIPTKELLIKIASLGKGEFAASCRFIEFDKFIDAVPGVRGESTMGKYLVVQEWALRCLFFIHKGEVSTSSGEQKTTTDFYMKEMRAWVLMEQKKETKSPQLVDNKKWKKADGAKAGSEAEDMVKLKDEGMPIFEGDNLIGF